MELPSAGLFMVGKVEGGNRKDEAGARWYGRIDVGGFEPLEVSAEAELAITEGFAGDVKPGRAVVLSVTPRLWDGKIFYRVRSVVSSEDVLAARAVRTEPARVPAVSAA